MPPVVDERLLSDPRDLARMIGAVRNACRLANRPELRATCVSAIPDRDRDLGAVLLASVTDGKHASCTCPIGMPGDGRAVVGPDGNVFGVDHLFVADLSIAPALPRANTHLTAVMIGEHIATRLRQRQSPGS